MKLTSLFKGVEKTIIKLAENQLFSVKVKHIEIHCLHGTLWITWPKRRERILKSGQTFRAVSKGKVCIVALSSAFFLMKKGRWSVNEQHRRELGVGNKEADVFPIPFETLGFINTAEKT